MALDWGRMAGGAQDALQQLLEQRMLEEQMALAQRRQAAEEQHRAATLEESRAGRLQQSDQFTQTHGLNTQRFKRIDVPTADVNNRRTGILAGNDQQRGLTEAGQDADYQFAREAYQRGEATPHQLLILGFKDGMTPEERHQKELELVKARGDQATRAASVGTAAFSERPVQVQSVDENGDPVTTFVRPSENVGKTFGRPPTAGMRERMVSQQQIGELFKTIRDLSSRIHTADSLPGQASQGILRGVGAKTYQDEDARQYNALIGTFKPMFARAYGHTGVLTEPDVQSVLESFPGLFAPKSYANKQWATLEQIIARANAATRKAAAGSNPTGGGETGGTEPAVVGEVGPDGKLRRFN